MEKIFCNIFVYQPETDTFIRIALKNTITLLEKRLTFIGMTMFPFEHHTEFSYVPGNPQCLSITLGFFYQLLYTNQYFFNTILVLSHTHIIHNTYIQTDRHTDRQTDTQTDGQIVTPQ